MYKMSDKGLTHIYFGDGKGKTTAALGLALRAAGCGMKVVIVQFLKDWKCGELDSLEQLSNVTVIRGKPFGGKFIYDMTEEEKHVLKSGHDECLRNALDLLKNRKCDLLILDEATDAYKLGVLDTVLFENLLITKPDSLELVITGHKPEAWMLDKADYVTEMKKHKHPYDKGISARKGIEF